MAKSSKLKNHLKFRRNGRRPRTKKKGGKRAMSQQEVSNEGGKGEVIGRCNAVKGCNQPVRRKTRTSAGWGASAREEYVCDAGHSQRRSGTILS